MAPVRVTGAVRHWGCDAVVVAVVAGEPAAGVRRTGWLADLFHLEAQAGRAVARGGGGQGGCDRGGQAGPPVAGMDLDRGQAAQAEWDG